MSLLSTVLFVIGAVHLLLGVPALLTPEHVRRLVAPRYAQAVGGRREWRGFGAGLTSIGVSLLLIANGLAA